jgi:hypothetical protein
MNWLLLILLVFSVNVAHNRQHKRYISDDSDGVRSLGSDSNLDFVDDNRRVSSYSRAVDDDDIEDIEDEQDEQQNSGSDDQDWAAA